MSFKIASKFHEAAACINNIPVDKFPLLLNRVIQKLHLRGIKLFNEDESIQLQKLFEFNDETLKLVLDSLCYIFEQAAFSSTGPEPLYEILQDGGFDEPHSKVVGKIWSTEAPGFISKLKKRSLGNTTLLNTDYQLNIKLSDSNNAKLQDGSAVLQLKLGKPDDSLTISNNEEEIVTMEFNHSELFSFFTQLDKIQKQLDSLSST